MAGPTHNLEEARRVHDEAILVDGQGVTVLLPVAQVVPAAVDGVPYLDRAISGGVTAQNVTLGNGDDALRALAECGGVIGITAYGPLCETTPGVRPGLGDMVDHIAYVADLVGVDHVGIGSDFFESESPVRFHAFFRVRYPEVFGEYRLDNVYFDDFNRVDHFPRLTAALIERGFSPEETTKILGGNFMRVFDRAWNA